MERKTLDEWTAFYEQKTGRTFQRSEGFRLFYYPEKGFCEIGVDLKNKIVVGYQMCGDAWFWRRMLEFLAVSLDIPCCGTFCIRRVKPYIRFWGFTIEREETTGDGLLRYFCRDKYTKAKATCSPAWRDDTTGEYTYSITWEVTP